MLTLDRLKYFKAVAMTEHVGKAAKDCHISPSVISSAISVLEDELSCSLFTKENNRLRLNENGQQLLEKSKHLLNEVDNIYTQIGKKQANLRGHYRISGSSFLLKEFLLEGITKLGEEHANLSLEFSVEDTISTLAHLNSGQADLGLIFKSIHTNDIEEHVLYEGEFYICVRKSNPILKSLKTKRIELLNKLPAIVFKSPQGSSLYEDHPQLKKVGIKTDHKYFYNHNDISLDLLKSTDGWALLPDLIYKKHQKDLSIVRLEQVPKISMKVCLVKSKRKPSFLLFNKIKERLFDSFSKV